MFCIDLLRETPSTVERTDHIKVGYENLWNWRAHLDVKSTGICNSSDFMVHRQTLTIFIYNHIVENLSCGSLQFMCRDKTCILQIHVCDGVADCPNSTDEDNNYCTMYVLFPSDTKYQILKKMIEGIFVSFFYAFRVL